MVRRRSTRIVFTHQNLVKEVLNELLLKRTRGKKAVQVGTEQLGHCAMMSSWIASLLKMLYSPTYISSSGEMKMSLRLMTCGIR